MTIVIALIAICLSLLTTPTEAKGKCIPFPSSNRHFLDGIEGGVCKSLLEAAGFTHYWLDGDDIPNVPTSDDPDIVYDPFVVGAQCVSETFYLYEQPTRRMVNIFTANEPSPLCQNVLTTISCLHDIKICDPELDIDVYATETIKKPCGWLCDMVHQDIGDFCTANDLAFFSNHGIELQLQPGMAPTYFNCDSDRWAVRGAEDVQLPNGDMSCIAPLGVPTEPVAARCEQYNGGYCETVFPAGTHVYIPAGSIQSEMEAEISHASFFLNAIPTTGTCAEDTLRINCQSVFKE